MPPMIGITGFRQMIAVTSGPHLPAVMSADDYAQGVEAAGGMPLVIPYVTREETIVSLAQMMDGLLLAGGEDVDPALFGENPKTGLREVIPERDRLEFALLREMQQRSKPVFGICRGMQVLNVALGGTLYQDLAVEWRGRIQHTQRARRDHLSQTIRLKPDSRIQACLNQAESIRCNSFHHQAIKRVAPVLTATAWDDEGLVEAVEAAGDWFAIAVQWHPENLWRTSPEQLGLFRALVDAARR